jgi:hypothetical protein
MTTERRRFSSRSLYEPTIGFSRRCICRWKIEMEAEAVP